MHHTYILMFAELNLLHKAENSGIVGKLLTVERLSAKPPHLCAEVRCGLLSMVLKQGPTRALWLQGAASV